MFHSKKSQFWGSRCVVCAFVHASDRDVAVLTSQTLRAAQAGYKTVREV